MSAMSDVQVGGNQNFDDLKKLVITTLEKNGVLGELRAMIRTHVYNAIEKDDHDHQRPKAAKLMSSHNGELVAELVAEFLEFHQLKHALKIYRPEISLPTNHRSRSELAHSCNLPRPDVESSLLQQLLTGIGETRHSIPKHHHQPQKQVSPSHTPLLAHHLASTRKEEPTVVAPPASTVGEEDKSVRKLDLSSASADSDLKSPGRSDPMYLSPRATAAAKTKPSPAKPATPEEDSIEADMTRLRQINDEILKLTLADKPAKYGYRGQVEEVDLDEDDEEVRVSASYEFHAPPRVQAVTTQRSQDSDNVVFESKEFMPDLGGDSVDSSALDGCDHFEEIEKSEDDN